MTERNTKTMQYIKSNLTNLLNSLGLYTLHQYLHEVESKEALSAYATELEKAVSGMSDPTRPIVVFGRYVHISNVSLLPSQQIIVSPYARDVNIENIYFRAGVE